VLVADGLSHDDWEERLLNRTFAPPATPLSVPASVHSKSLACADWLGGYYIVARYSEDVGDWYLRTEREKVRAGSMAVMLREPANRFDSAVAWLERVARDSTPLARFQLGVAYRMRHDSEAAQPGDFQNAVDHWSAALAADPSQYIWRRRLQQYGPRLDKPYPFYGWIEEARAEIKARGETPVRLAPEPSGAERDAPAKGMAAADAAAPPEGADRVPRDTGDWLEVETAVVFDTLREQPVARVHVALRPNAERKVHWNNEVERVQLWIGEPELPDGWQADARRLVGELLAAETSQETRRFEFELRPPAGGGTLRAFVLFHACEDVDGECVYLRRDLELTVTPPGAPDSATAPGP
jgi:hypothetical protein